MDNYTDSDTNVSIPLDEFCEVPHCVSRMRTLNSGAKLLFGCLVGQYRRLGYFHFDPVYYAASFEKSERSVLRLMQDLAEHGLLLCQPLTEEAAAAALQAKTPQQSQVGLTLPAVCSWCSCRTAYLHQHHYPVPKAQGGIDTVGVCPNCHAEFHHIIRTSWVMNPAFAESLGIPDMMGGTE